MTPAEQIAAIYGVGGTVFLAGFLLAVITTGARAIWYLRHRGQPLPALPFRPSTDDVVAIPRLLVRDVIVKTGLCVSFGLIAAIRFLPPDARMTLTQGNVAWALVTTIPACIAIVTYDLFELLVIPRARL